MRKIIVVITARPSYSRIRDFLLILNNDQEFDLGIVLANSAIVSNYGDLRQVIKQDGLSLLAEVSNMLIPNGITTVPKSTALMLYELSEIFHRESPDAVITIADRYETLATSIASSYMNIPLIHVQGGEISGNIDEKTRHANTKLADLHMVCSHLAEARVLAMGESPDSVFNCGCPSIDLAARATKKNFSVKQILSQYNGIGTINYEKLDDYIVVLQHPESENPNQAEFQITLTLQAVYETEKQVFVFWPNADAGTDGTSRGIRRFREKYNPDNFFFYKNFEPEDFIRLVSKSSLLIGNSSVGIREASYLKIPVLNLGIRQKNRDRGPNVTDCDFDINQINEGIIKLTNLNHNKFKRNYMYGDGDASIKMLDALRQFDYRYSKINNWNE